MDESDGSASGSDDEDEEEEEDEDEDFENEVAEAEEDIQEERFSWTSSWPGQNSENSFQKVDDDDDDGCDMDLCDDEQNENAKDFEEMEQGYIDGGKDPILISLNTW